MECVLQGERSVLMQFSMKLTVAVLFLLRSNKFVRNKGPEGSLIIQGLRDSGMPLKGKISHNGCMANIYC